MRQAGRADVVDGGEPVRVVVGVGVLTVGVPHGGLAAGGVVGQGDEVQRRPAERVDPGLGGLAVVGVVAVSASGYANGCA